MDIFANLDLLSVGIAIATTAVLGFTVYFSNKSSVTNKTFIAFALITGIWGIANYISYHVDSPYATLWLLRIVLFFATWQAFTLFQFFYVFPRAAVVFPVWHRFIIVPVASLISMMTLTPVVFSGIGAKIAAGVASPITENGIYIFGLINIFLVITGIGFLIVNLWRAQPEHKKQYATILTGALAMFSLIIFFNFLSPVFFDNVSYIPLGAVFILPFALLTTYAIVKGSLFNVKVAATALLTIILATVAFLEIIFADSTVLVIFRVSVFTLVLIVGISLVKGVIKEVESREKIQALAKDLETANTKLKAADLAKSEFLSIAAHQLRTPLTAIKGYISMFLEGDYGQFTEPQTKELESIYRSADRLTRLIDVFLNVSRIETGRLDLKKEPVQFMEIVEAVTRDLAQQAAKKGLKVTVQPSSEPLPLIMMDRDKIHDVTMNLVDNAIKYTPSGWVNLRISRTPSLLTFQVQDSGMGISAADIDKLFQKFTRAEAVTRIHTGGSGLGLFVAKKIVETHGGRIWVESEGEGKGSLFNFTLPIVTEEKNDRKIL